jgi:hypothetical protein
MLKKQTRNSGFVASVPGNSDLSITITPLKASRNPERMDAIGAVVDSFRNLHASVVRFVLMLEDARGSMTSSQAASELGLTDLLTRLEKNARALGFSRMQDLTAAIESAQTVEQERELIFSASLGADLGRLRKLAQHWERLDATFVGLCVGHVLEHHYRGRASKNFIA